MEEIFGEPDKCRSHCLTSCISRNCDLQVRPRQMRALMILKIILESNRRDKWSRAPITQGSEWESAGFRGGSLAWLLGALSACQPVALHAGQSPWICIVLSEEQAQDVTFGIPSLVWPWMLRRSLAVTIPKCSELQKGRVSQLWHCWQFGLDNSFGAVLYTALSSISRILNLYPLDVQLLCPGCDNQNVSRHC